MSQASSFDLADEILSLKKGDHLCLLYDRDPAEQMPALVPFIQDALSQGEQFTYIADDQTVDELAGRLEQSGINVGTEVDRGALNLWTRGEWRQPGELDSAKKSAQVRQFVADAARAGFKGSSFAVEMTWTLGPEISAAQLEHWEATLNTIFVPGTPGRIVCQYNRSRLSPEVMLAALHTHPLTILGDEVFPNLFYQAPLILHGPHATNGNGNGKIDPAAQVEWMISQLKRFRAMEKERAELIASRRADEAGRYLAAIVESSDDAIISKDLNSIITSWNTGAERIFGYTAEEIIGKPITVLIPPERQNEEPAILESIRRGQRIDHYETVRQRKDGSLVEISVTVSPIRDGRGKIVGASKIARNISEQKRLEERLERTVAERTASLRETVRELEAFSYSISHDLRAPLRSMQGFAQILLENHAGALDEQGRQYLQRITSASRRLDVLIQEVLNYARVIRAPVSLARVDAARLVRELIDLYPNWQPPAARIEIEGTLPPVSAHEGFLTQCLSNLIGNAVKFVAPGVQPQVRIRAERMNGHIQLVVQDNGIGVAPENRDRIFRMFERIHSPKEYEGTGMGLTIVRKAAERMGGNVGFESVLGQGSKFWIELPPAAPEEINGVG